MREMTLRLESELALMGWRPLRQRPMAMCHHA